jgi:hypothetical protein
MKEENNNLASDISKATNWLKDMRNQLFGSSGEKNYEDVAYFSNPDSIWDEVLKLSWFAMLVATAFTAYYGYRYHYSIFQNGGGNETEALIVSLVIFALGEVLKVFLGHRFFRSIFSGAIKNGLPQFVLTVCLGIIFYKAVIWSIDISAKGYGMVNASKATQEAIASQTDYTLLTKDIDAQIKQINENAAKGAAVTWKGKTTEDGQEIMKRNAKALPPLLMQKNAIIAQAMQRDSMMLAAKGVSIANAQARQDDYGGKAEYCVVFFLFMIGLLELVNYRMNQQYQEKIKEHTAKEPDPRFKSWFTLNPRPATAEKKTGIDGRTKDNEDDDPPPPARPIGFRFYPVEGVSTAETVATNPESVATPVGSVATPDKGKADINTKNVVNLLKKQKSDIDSEIANFTTRNGTPDTIRRRIVEKYRVMSETIGEYEYYLQDEGKFMMKLYDWKEIYVNPIINGASPESLKRKGHKEGRVL